MDSKIDNGRIIKQYKYKIDDKMDIQELEYCINKIIKKILKMLSIFFQI